MKLIMGEEDVKAIDRRKELTGELVVIKESWFNDTYREGKYQLVLVYEEEGNLEKTVWVMECCNGDCFSIDKDEIIGIATEKAVEQWKKAYGNFDQSVNKNIRKYERQKANDRRAMDRVWEKIKYDCDKLVILDNFRMFFQYMDGFNTVIGGEDEEDCMTKAISLTPKHGDMAYYTGICDEYYSNGELIEK